MLRVARNRWRAARRVRGRSRRFSVSGRPWICRAYSRASSGRMREPAATGTSSCSRRPLSRAAASHLDPMIASAQSARTKHASCSKSLITTQTERSWTYSGFSRISRACSASTASALGRTTVT